jgi:hypothetical protein
MSYYDTCFDYGSMTKKYQVFTGKNCNYSGNNDINFIKENFPMVSLEGNQKLADQMYEVRNWCQEQFGNNWIYEWNDFYFINNEDAMLFTLRWQ